MQSKGLMSFLLFSLFPIFIKTSENSASFAYKYTSRIWFTFSTLITSFFQDTSFFLRLNHCLGSLTSSLFQLLLTITYIVTIIGLKMCNLQGPPLYLSNISNIFLYQGPWTCMKVLYHSLYYPRFFMKSSPNKPLQACVCVLSQKTQECFVKYEEIHQLIINYHLWPNILYHVWVRKIAKNLSWRIMLVTGKQGSTVWWEESCIMFRKLGPTARFFPALADTDFLCQVI